MIKIKCWITDYIKVTKDEILNISNLLKGKISKLNFNFWCFFYKNQKNDKNDIHDLYKLTDDEKKDLKM